MKALQWLPIVVVVVVGFVGRSAIAQDANSTGVALAQNTTPAQANPATAVVPPAQGTPACNNCPTPCNTCCEVPVWHAFGEYLLLRPRNEGIEYAVPANGPVAAGQTPLQVGPTATVDPQFQSGFSVGIERVLSECSSISLSYTYYRNDAYDGPVTATTPFVLRSMVFNPSSADAATDWALGSAHEAVNFNLVDLDYHYNLWKCDCSSINYLIGARYAQLGQQFDANFQSIIAASVNTNVEFDGAGLRLGLDGERMIGCGLFIAAKADANLLGGQFGASYLQSNTNTPVVATTTWHEARFLTILETEVAIGWQSCDGHVRTSVGYLISDWFNVVKPSDFISSVQTNHYRGTDKIGDTSLVFDGLTARIELLW